jgi:hypothetical protein
VNRPLYTATRKDWVYTIQFQNTGNYPAQDVLITDLLHPLLAPSTLRVLGASHGKPTLTWSEGHQLSFRFNNINLPDSVHDEPASHGYLTYSINPSAHAKTGDTITNAAAIYFDYNEPVITDPTNNILVQPLDVRSVATTHRFIAYPNPAARNLSIVSDAAGNAILTDMLGRRIAVYRLDSGKQQFQLPDGISTGVYILEGVNKEGETLGILRLMVL